MPFKWGDNKDDIDVKSESIIRPEDLEEIRKQFEKEYVPSDTCTSFYSAYSPLCPSPKSEEREAIINKQLERFVYLDNNATHPLLDSVKTRIAEMMNLIGNASSKHLAGEKVRAYLESARANIAARLDIEDASTIFFTASGSESNNTFLKGVAFKNIDGNRKEIVTTPYEHKAILRVVEYLGKFGFIPRYTQLDSSGLVDTEHLKSIVNENTLLVSIMASNNEVGTILPIHEYHEIVKAQSNALFHSDMSQTIGKVENIEIRDLDSVTITAHKFGGPAGVSVLYLKDRDCLDPLIHGGNQEFNKRAGTYNAPLVSGMNIAFMELEKLDYDRIAKLRNYLDEQLLANFDCRINCKSVDRMVNTTSVTFKEFIGDELIGFLSEHGIFISSSSACTSHEKNPSHVLKALGMSDEEAYRTVRVSLSRYSSKEEIDIFIDTIKQFKR